MKFLTIDLSSMKIIFMVIQIQKVLKKACQNIQHILPKLDEFQNNICNIKDELNPHILGMCETFLNEEKCKKNSRELVD
jgi:hypothetical protein